MPVCAENNHIMEELTGVQINTGEQNKDMFKARQVGDLKDTMTIVNALAVHTSFSRDNDNLNNADTAKSVGENILSSMN